MELAKLFVHQARLHEEEPALAFTGGVSTYGMLARAVLSVADRLAEAAIARGGIAAIDVANPFHHMALILACELQGVPTASLQTPFSAKQAGLEVAVVLTDGRFKHPDGVRIMLVEGDWFLTNPQLPVDYGRLLALPGFGDENALCRVILSSGTTGVPKSTGFTPAIVERRVGDGVFMLGGFAGMRVACLMSFSTLPGYGQPMGALSGGGMVCIATTAPDALHLMRLFNVDVITVAVVQVQALLQAQGNAPPLPTLRRMYVTGSKMPADLMRQARAKLCTHINFAYGTTETGVISNAPASMIDGMEGAAGFVVPWMTLEVVDGEDRPLPPGEEGVMRVASTRLGSYIVDDPDNRLRFRDGWFYPGDVGRLHPSGMVQITGRSVEVINRGGSIIGPEVIEQALELRPEVREAAAFGVPGPWVDDIWAVVVADERFNEQELIKFCRERLADKAPGVIRRVASIPRTELGKIRRKQLRDEAVPAR